MKIIRVLETITVVLSNGEIISSSTCSDELFNEIYKNQHDEDLIKSLLLPEFNVKKEIAKARKELFEGISSSKHLTTKGRSVYILSISELSLPEDLVKAFLKAEAEDNQELIETYLNFWTLVSLNPDSRCRQNMFWFLDKYGMKISKSGLFVGYRNVSVKKQGSNINSSLASFISTEYSRIKFVSKKSPKDYNVYSDLIEGYHIKRKIFIPEAHEVLIGNLSELYSDLSNVEVSTVYTDDHTRTFEIKLGQVVSMPRENCDSIQENSCSRGLHVAGKDWLEKYYFGEVGLMVLVNPADVVAVPPIDGYGKMRTCAYYPVSVVEFGPDNHIIEMDIENGFEDDFMEQICYIGDINSDDIQPYHVTIPDIPEIDKSKINNRLRIMAININKVV